VTGNNQHRRTILVTDGEQRATLAVVRSLGAAGHVVHVSASAPRSLAAASRFVRTEHTVPDALSDPDRFAHAIHRIATANGIDTIFPMTEPALLALLPLRDRFDGVLIPFADADTFAGISDKQAVLVAAGKVGIAVPAQDVIPDRGASELIDLSSLQYPIVVKPARSVSTGSDDRLKLSAQHAASREELGHIIRNMDARAYPLLLQQRIVGPGIGIFALVWNGRLIAQFAHRRIREKPPSGGVSVYRESIAVDADLLRMSLALLAEFRWSGVAMVEYKVDQQTSQPYLMEINGRFWGSLQLAIDSGVDFPNLLMAAATGQNPEPVVQFATGVRSRWFWGDVDHLVTRLRRSDRQLSLPNGAPSRWATLKAFFSRHPGDINEIQRRDDMRPFLRESVLWFQQVWR